LEECPAGVPTGTNTEGTSVCGRFCASLTGEAVYAYDFMVKMALETIAVCSMGTAFDTFDSEGPGFSKGGFGRRGVLYF